MSTTMAPKRACVACASRESRARVIHRRGIVSTQHSSSRSWRLVSAASPRGVGDRVFDDPFFTDSLAPPGSLFGGEESFARTFREMDRSMDAISRRVDKNTEQADALRSSQNPESGAPRGYQREGTMTQQLPGGGVSKTYYRESVVTWGGGQSHVFGDAYFSGTSTGIAIFAGLLIGVYIKAAKRFAEGFHSTIYSATEKTQLTLFWPLLWLTDAKGFREQFRVAMKARGVGVIVKDESKDDRNSEQPSSIDGETTEER